MPMTMAVTEHGRDDLAPLVVVPFAAADIIIVVTVAVSILELLLPHGRIEPGLR